MRRSQARGRLFRVLFLVASLIRQALKPCAQRLFRARFLAVGGHTAIDCLQYRCLQRTCTGVAELIKTHNVCMLQCPFHAPDARAQWQPVHNHTQICITRRDTTSAYSTHTPGMSQNRSHVQTTCTRRPNKRIARTQLAKGHYVYIFNPYN